jgi:ABC-2 type transport system ATP-binding protein
MLHLLSMCLSIHCGMHTTQPIPLAISISGLSKTYASGTRALDGVTLSIAPGDFFALLGPNGAGKTTIIGIITGLVNKTAGSVSVLGYDIDTSPELAKRQIGVVPQELNFNIFENPLDIVVNQAGYYGIPRVTALPVARELLEKLGLSDKQNRKSMELSGGMKRRLMIARALIHRPKILILDEPTAGVDVELRRGMWDFLRSLSGEGLTILLTTHYLEEAEQLCNHVAIIGKGKIAAAGTMKEVLSRLTTERVLIDLAQSVPEEVVRDLSRTHPARALDENTIEVEVDRQRGLNDVLLFLYGRNLAIHGVRSKSGRLEEVFMSVTKS